MGLVVARARWPVRAHQLEPPDFHAVFEVWLDNGWWLVDPTRLAPVEGLVRIACGRDAADIRLLPVSKTVPEERLRTAFAAGITQMGENKVQEAQRKSENLADLGISWSVIGHLQTNKAKNVAAFADEFQALDSLRLAEALDRRLQAAGRGLDVYVQVNSSGEPSKFGLEPDDVADFLAALPAYSSLRVRGLMTLAANTSDEARVRECFSIMRRLRETFGFEGTPIEIGMRIREKRKRR